MHACVTVPKTRRHLGVKPPLHEPATALLENVLILSARHQVRFPSYVAACVSQRSQSAVEMKEKMHSGSSTGEYSIKILLFFPRKAARP